MPKAKLILELDNAKSRFNILKGNLKFKHSEVSMNLEGNRLVFEIEGKDSKAVASAVGSIVKQMHIMDEAEGALVDS